MTNKKLKILLLGTPKGFNRVQHLLYAIIDAQHNIAMVSTGYYCPDKAIPWWSRLLVNFAKVISFFEAVFKAIWADIIYLMPMNNSDIITAVFVAKIMRRPLIAEMYLSSYQTALDRDTLGSNKSIRAKYYKKLDAWMITKPDYVIVLSKTELQSVANNIHTNIDWNKVRVCPLAVPPRRTSIKVNDDIFCVAWWGSYVPLHGLSMIVAAAKLVAKQDRSIIFNLYGIPSPEAEKYHKLIINEGLEEVVHLYTNKRFSDGSLEAELVNKCDLALGIFGSSVKADVIIPNKIIEAMSMRLPVLTAQSSALMEFFDINEDLFVCDRNAASLSEAILKIKGIPNENLRRAMSGYDKWSKHFTAHNYKEKVMSTISDASVNS